MQVLAKSYLTNPVYVQIGKLDITVNDHIEQLFEFLDQKDKRKTALKLLQKFPPNSKVLIFCQTQKGSERLARDVKIEG